MTRSSKEKTRWKLCGSCGPIGKIPGDNEDRVYAAEQVRLQKIQEKLMQLKIERESLLRTRLGTGHPDIKRLDDTIAYYESEMSDESEAENENLMSHQPDGQFLFV